MTCKLVTPPNPSPSPPLQQHWLLRIPPMSRFLSILRAVNRSASAVCKAGSFSFFCSQLKFHFLREFSHDIEFLSIASAYFIFLWNMDWNPKLPYSFPCYLTFSLDSKLHEGRDFVMFMAVCPGPSKLPGSYEVLNKWIVNK